MRVKLLRIGALAALLAALILLPPSSGSAAINPMISFQGKLTNPDGTNVTDNNYSIRFRIYTDPTADTGACANTCKWEETQASVTVSGGIFHVNLGSVTTLPGSVDFNGNALYLAIKVGSDAEMTPRVRLTATPYAFNSDTLDGLDSANFVQLSAGNINIGSGTVTSGAVNGITIGSTIQPSAAGALTVRSNGSNALNLTGGAASTWDIGNNLLSLQTTNNGAITTGTGLWTQGGNLTFSGSSARTITGPSTGGLTLTVGSGPLALSTTTSGTLSLSSAGALNLTAAAASTWSTGGSTLTVTSSNFNVSNAGAITAATSTNTINNLVINNGSLTNVGANITASGGLTVASGGSSALSFDSASNTIQIAATDTTIQRAASGTFTLDLNNAAATTLAVTNSDGTGVASLTVEGDITASGVFKQGANTGISTTCSGGQFLQNQVAAGGIVTGGTCASASGGGAPVDAQYLVLQADSTLSAERILTAGTNIIITDGGANGNLTINVCSQTCSLPGDITPTQITADQDDYNPSGLSTSSVLRLDASQFVSISGLAGGADGRIMSLVNVGSQPIRLADENTGSTAANRFALGGDIFLMPNDAQLLMYDSTSSRWRSFSINTSSRSWNPTSRILSYDEFITTAVTSSAGWAATVSGTGASCQIGSYGINSTNKAIGVWQCDVGTTATGIAALNLSTNTMVPAQGTMVFIFRVAAEALSTSTEEFTLRAGLMDTTGAGDTTDGIYFEYDRATAGDFWRIGASGGGTRTETTSSQAVNTNYIWLMAVTNPAWTSVDFFAKTNASTTWTDLGNIADANIPTATELVAPMIKMQKTVGTTQRNADIDAFFMYYDISR